MKPTKLVTNASKNKWQKDLKEPSKNPKYNYVPTDRIESFTKECYEYFDETLFERVEFYENKLFNLGRKYFKLSPIEKLFVMAFETTRIIHSSNYLGLTFQKEIKCKSGKIYYPDFSFYCNAKPHYSDLNLLIELDGHIWHEKSPEKVEQDKIRERELIDNGYTIVRYSGREVYRNPFKVVEECCGKYVTRIIEEEKKNGGI